MLDFRCGPNETPTHHSAEEHSAEEHSAEELSGGAFSLVGVCVAWETETDSGRGKVQGVFRISLANLSRLQTFCTLAIFTRRSNPADLSIAALWD
jgi:hypothetical protein